MVTKGKVMKKLAAIFSISLVSVCAFGAWPSDYFQFTDARVRPLVEAIDLYGDDSGVTNLGPTVNAAGNLSAASNITANTLHIDGASTLNALSVTAGATRVDGTFKANDAITAGAGLSVTAGATRVDGTFKANSTVTLGAGASVTAGTFTAAGNVVVTGATTVNTMRALGRISEPYAGSIPVTNAQILLMTSRSADYTAAGQGDETCTNVLAGPGASGVGVFVTVNNIGVSNAIELSKTAALMGPAISMAPTSSVTMLGFDANTWIVTGKYP